jgi:glycosyltransferase involved in cell wall biosynthesis
MAGVHEGPSMTEHWNPTTPPLILHVIPTPAARGAQREARALADQLDSPGVRRHKVLSLFDGSPEVTPDFSVGFPDATNAAGFDPRLVPRLRAALTHHDPTVVISHGSDPMKYLVAAMIGRRRPLVYYAIGTYAGPRDRRLQVCLWRFLTGRADRVAACGEEVRSECTSLLGVPPARVFLTANGRDPAVFFPREPGAVPTQPTVVFVGALTAGKRPDRFIDVVAALRARGIQLRAKVIGDGPLYEELIGPAKAVGVEMLGARSDVAALLRQADLLMFPSLPAGEGMPGVLIEAGLCGLPVVATAVPGVSTIVADGETGLVAATDDLGGLVDAMARLLEDHGARATMGQAARARCVERFSLSVVADRWLTILRPLFPDPRAGLSPLP